MSECKELTLGSLFDGLGGWLLAATDCGIKPVWSSEIDEFPMAVSKYHFPDVEQLGDITKINGAEIEPVDIICAGSPCFVAGTFITTKRGLLPIEQVEIGDKVLTHTNEWHMVTDRMVHGSDNLYSVKVAGSFETIATGNHPYYVSHMHREWNNTSKADVRVLEQPKWVEVKDLQKDDFIGYPIDSREENPLGLSKEECWLLGRYVADGYINNSQRSGRSLGQLNHKVIFCVGSSKTEFFESKVTTYHFCKKSEKTVAKYEITNERLMNLCNLCGRGAINKQIPDIILRLPVELLRQFIDGYISGDGCYIKDKNLFSMTTISVKLALGLQMAVHKVFRVPCGIHFCKRPATHVIEGRTVKQHDTYMVRFYPCFNKQTHAILKDNIIWQRVRKVEQIVGRQPVYNLEVDKDHSYTANGVIVHNCQNLSMAGNRKGLDGEESGLFIHSVRIVREMREATNGEYPKWFVWENVPGAFSSNKGNDFRVVLEEIAETTIPMPKSGKWAKAGMVRSDKCYLSWRVLDAQYWGTAQRRARVFIIASLGKDRRPEVLFEPESVPWNPPQSREQGKETPRDTRESSEKASRTVCIEGNGTRASHMGDGYKESDIMYTLNTVEKHAVCTENKNVIGVDGYNSTTTGDVVAPLRSNCGDSTGSNAVMHKVYGLCSLNSNSMKLSNPNSGIYEADTTRTLDLNGGNPSCNQGGMMIVEGKNEYVKCIGNGQVHQLYLQDKAGALNCMSDQQKIIYALDRASFNQGKNAKYDFRVEEDKCSTLVAKGPSAVAVPIEEK